MADIDFTMLPNEVDYLFNKFESSTLILSRPLSFMSNSSYYFEHKKFVTIGTK